MAEHKDLTGSDLHEPKGQSIAAQYTVYVADGSGSGTHQKLTEDSLDLTDIESPNTYRLNAVLADVSTSSFILVPVPDTSVFTSATLVLGGAITVADASVSFTRDDGSSFGTAVTVAFTSSAEGDTYSFTPSLNTTITGPGYIKIASNGGSTDTQPLFISVTLSRSL